MRPVDLAREHGLSSQAIRNYEDAGVLGPVGRRPSGHRTYTAAHAQALRAFLALVRGHGYATATAVLVAFHDGRAEAALELLDRSHADLLADRRVLDAVEVALGELTDEPDERFPDRTEIGALAHQLGLRPATLRRWERAGLLHPERERVTGYRVYGPADVRDAHLVRQLRRSGYPLAAIAPLLADLRDAGDPAAAVAAVHDRRAVLHARARAMLRGAAELAPLLP